MPEKIIFSICGMCSVHCPVQVNVQNGECTFIQGNPHVQGIKGALCVRGAAGLELVKDDQRPQFPMIRKAGRGEGRWLRVSWNEALDRVAEKISAIQAKHGKHSIIGSDGDGFFSDLYSAFFRGLSSPNYHTASDTNANNAARSLFGFGSDAFVMDYRNSRHVVLQTRNVFESIDVKEVNDLLDGIEAGCKLSVIDIRATVTAGKADTFLMIRPGTDYALNLSVINVILNNQYYDKAFTEKWIGDLEALKSFVVPYTPQWAEKETGIKAEAIISLVADLSQAAPSVIWHPGRMTARYKDSFYVSRTAFIINALLGSIGATGGLALAVTPEKIHRKGLKKLSDLLPEASKDRADGVGSKYPVFDSRTGLLHKALAAVESGTPYPVQAYLSFGHDLLSEYPDPKALMKILDKLELLVSVTSGWNHTAWYSDVVLPVSSYLEQESILFQQNGLKPAFGVRQRCVDPWLDTMAEWEIIAGLSKRLGISPLAFDKIQDIWKYQLQETGILAEDFEKTGMVELTNNPVYEKLNNVVLKTSSQKIEIVNPEWEKAGIISLKPYEAGQPPKPGFFRLTVGGCAIHSHGQTINNKRLFSQMPENELWINELSAKGMNIEDGELVEVSASGYSGRIKARLSQFIHPEAVFMVDGFGRSIPAESRAFGKGVSSTALMSGGLDRWDSAGGGLALQEHFVSVKKLQ